MTVLKTLIYDYIFFKHLKWMIFLMKLGSKNVFTFVAFEKDDNLGEIDIDHLRPDINLINKNLGKAFLWINVLPSQKYISQ